uniref:Uncharacterized protein n=1 Tax=Trichogramma kaykai TaxID=54128 RepID=A0ABD2X9E0_9HYME
MAKSGNNSVTLPNNSQRVSVYVPDLRTCIFYLRDIQVTLDSEALYMFICLAICRVARVQKYDFSLYVFKLKSEYLLFHGEEDKICTRSRYSSRESIVARLQQTRKQRSRFLISKPSISKSQKNLNVNPSLNLMLQVSRPNLTAFYDICPRNFGKKEKGISWPCTYRRRESRSYTGAQSREKVNSAASLASRHGAKSHSTLESNQITSSSLFFRPLKSYIPAHR